MGRNRCTPERIIRELMDELLDREVFNTLLEAKVLVERWRRHYNQVRPHSVLGYRPPALKAIEPVPPGSIPSASRHWLHRD